MARGSQAKTLIGTAILNVFPGAFIDSDGKTIRIPANEDGTDLEIKITLTAAKDIVGGQPAMTTTDSQPIPQNKEMTEEEIKAVRDLIERLNL